MDQALVESIAATEARCMVIGQQLPRTLAFGFDLPVMPAAMQPVVDILPVQLGAYVHAVRTGKNPDVFYHREYVVTREGAL